MPSRASANSTGDVIPPIPLLRVSDKESFDAPIDRRSESYRHQAAEAARQRPPAQPLLTIPNVLTFTRLVLVPVFMWLWYAKWYPQANFAAAIVFIAASITDWLDGFLARKLKIATVFGAFLDPVADKIMVTAALVLLATEPPHPLTQADMTLPVIIMICREITMSALREWASAAGSAVHKAVKVNSLGKWKTALQMLSMATLLWCRQPGAADRVLTALLPGTLGAREAHAVTVAFIMLWAATGLAVWSLAIYMSNVWTHFIYPQEVRPHEKKAH